MKISYISLFVAMSITTIPSAYGDNLPVGCYATPGGTQYCNDYCAETITQIDCTNSTYCNCKTCANGKTPVSTTVKPDGSVQSITYNKCNKKIILEPISCPSTCPSTSWGDVSGKDYQTACGALGRCIYRCKKGFTARQARLK